METNKNEGILSSKQEQIKKANKRNYIIDKIAENLFKSFAIISALLVVMIIFVIAQRGIRPFFIDYDGETANFLEFITGMFWDGRVAGVLFIIINTIIAALLAGFVAIPISVLTALFVVRVAPRKVAAVMETIIELLASVPSIIYGVFGSIVLTKYITAFADLTNQTSRGGVGLLATVLVLTFMIIPTITIVTISALKGVDKKILEGSLALGASETQTNFKVAIPAAKNGIFAGAILGIGRALGEATAVSMVAGNAFSGIAIGPFELTRTLTSTILSGIKEVSGITYDIRFSIGLVLMAVIILMNIILNKLKKKFGGVEIE